MNRRDFIKHIAFLAAGAAALPDQILAFERSMEINAIDKIEKGLIFADDIILGGIAGHSFPMAAEFSTNGMSDLNFALNLFGGCFRWAAIPGHSLRITIPEKMIWIFDGLNTLPEPGVDFAGGMRLINQDGKYVYADFKSAKYSQIGDYRIQASLDSCKELVPLKI